MQLKVLDCAEMIVSVASAYKEEETQAQFLDLCHCMGPPQGLN